MMYNFKKHAKKHLKEIHFEDKVKYENAKLDAEKSGQILNDALQALEKQLKNENSQLKKLQNIIKDKEKQFIKGGNIISFAKKQEQELFQTKEELKQTTKIENVFEQKIEQIEIFNNEMNEKFDSIQDSITDKNMKLKKLFQKYQQKNIENNERKEENINEEKEFKENIHLLQKQLQLKNLIVSHFLPQKWKSFIEMHSKWDKNIDQWRIPALEYSGNNLLDVISDEMNEYPKYDQLRPISDQRMNQIWKRAKDILKDRTLDVNECENGIKNDSDIELDLEMNLEQKINIPEDIQQAIHIALETNIDPNVKQSIACFVSICV